jgi:hypothetical protein
VVQTLAIPIKKDGAISAIMAPVVSKHQIQELTIFRQSSFSATAFA